MSESLKDRLNDLDTGFLKEQYRENRKEYTQEALEIIADILRERGVSTDGMENAGTDTESYQEKDFSDLIPLDSYFRYGDVATVYTIIGHNNISFTIKPADEDARKDDPRKRYLLYVSPDDIDKAGEIIETHFEVSDGEYVNRHKSLKERLKSLSFHEAALYSADMKDKVELDLAPDEKKYLARYFERIIDEAEEIEKESGEFLFYYDNFGTLLEKIKSGDGDYYLFDLLPILEVLKTYCHEEKFPAELESVADGLIDIFVKH